MSEKLLTVPEVAASLRCTISCVRRWRREGRVAAIKLGRLVRIAESEVSRVVQEGLSPRKTRRPE